MADEEGFDFWPQFQAKTEYICQNDEGEGAAEAHAEVIDQSIRMLRFFFIFSSTYLFYI